MVNLKILVTGANGQLGNELQLLASVYPQYDFIFLTREEFPIDDEKTVREVFSKHHPGVCINCAAYTAVDKAETEKEAAFRINGRAVGSLAAICKERGCRFIHVSTDYVFDGTSSKPYKEDDAPNPQSVYGASKLEGEKLAVANNPGVVIIRTSWVYSAFGKNFVKTMLRLMKEKERVGVVSDQVGSPTYAADIAEAILKIITVPDAHGIYHFTNDGIISWYDFAVAIKELSGSQCMVSAITTAEYPTPAKRPAYSALDKTKIQQAFGISLRPWKQSLAACMDRLTKTKVE